MQLSSDAIRKLLALRESQDPLRSYTPGPTALRCFESRARYRWLGGPNRGGKSAHGAVELALAALRRHPTRSVKSVNGVYLVFAPSRDQLADPWGKKLLKESELKGDQSGFPLIPPWEIERVYWIHGAGAPVPKEVKLKNGNRILFFVSGDKNVWRRVQGKGMVLGIVVDESAGNDILFHECTARLLDANSHQKVREEAGGGWFLWLATETEANTGLASYIDKCEDPTNEQFEGFRIQPGENPAILQEEREKLRDVLGEEQYAIRMEGSLSQGATLRIFPQFSVLRHVRADDYHIGDDDNLWVGYDPGTNFTGIVIAALNRERGRKVRVVKCWQPRRTTIAHDVDLIRNFLQGRKVECIVYDPAARAVEKTGQSVYSQLGEKLRLARVQVWRGLAMGRNRHEDTIPVVRYYMDPNPKDPKAESLLELNPSPDSGCKLLATQLIAYSNRESPNNLLGTEHVVKENDHLVDALRYLLCERPGWVNRGPNPALWGEGTNGEAPPPISDPRVMNEQDIMEADRLARSGLAARRRLKRVQAMGVFTPGRW